MSLIQRYLPWLFERVEPEEEKPKHERVKEVLQKGVVERRDIAEKTETEGYLLDVLADDKDISVRRAVAANPKTPAKTSGRLALDDDDDVRLLLARRLVKLMPTLSPDEHAQVYALTVQALGTLAEDQVTNIRVALSSSLKDVAKTPHDLARKLAEDIEKEVAAPILRYSVVLSDQDLLEIINSQPVGWKFTEIASRKKVSSKVSKAIINKGPEEAQEKLLENDGATISREGLAEIIRRAETSPILKKALIDRDRLPRKLGRKFNSVMEDIIFSFLRKNSDLDAETAADVTASTSSRVNWADQSRDHEDDPSELVAQMAAAGSLTEEIIQDAISWNQKAFVVMALAKLANTDETIVYKIIKNKSAKGLVSVCWKANLSMRTALTMQQRIARIPYPKLIHPRGGSEYPLTQDEIKWQLEFFGIE